jgi:Flp pilus assembly protein TadB
VGVMRRLSNQEPAQRQITFLAIGSYSACFFSVVLVLVAMTSEHKLGLGLIIAGVIVVVEVPLSRWIVNAARRRQNSVQSDSTASQNSFSKRR